MKQKFFSLLMAIIFGIFSGSAFPILASTLPSPSDTLATDTTSTSLREVTVNADRSKVDLTSSSYYPAPDVKRSATDAIDLLQRMSMSEIHIDPVTKAITTIAGNDVRLFINFLPASEGEIAGLRGQDVKMVEVLDYPTDQRFEGSAHVVNILIRSYQYGGYTRLRDNHTFFVADDNFGSVFSRMNSKKMTYDLFVGSNLTSTSHRGTDQTTIYGLAAGSVERKLESLSNKNKSWYIPVSFRASYNSDNIQIANTVGYSFFDTYSQYQAGTLSFLPDFDSDRLTYASDRTGHSNAISYSGRFFFNLPREWNLYFRPTFSYAHNRSYRWYENDSRGFRPIVTDGREDTYYGYLSLGADKTFGQKHWLDVALNFSESRNRLAYTGSDVEWTDMKSHEFSAGVSYRFSSGGRFNIRASAYLNGIWNAADGDKMSEISPSASLNAAFKPNSKSRLNFSSSLSRITPGPVFANDLLVQVNELEYRRGNPAIKPWHLLNSQISYSYNPMEQLSLSAFVRHKAGFNVLSMVYERNPAGDAIWMTKRNTGHYNSISSGLSLSANLFSNNLSLNFSPAFQHDNLNTFFREVHNQFDFSVNAQYYISKFSFSAYYHPKAWTLHPTAGIRDTNRAYYYVGANWSNSAWVLSLKAMNFFRYTYHGQTTRIYSPDYNTTINIDIPAYHANIELTAVFTFGYGKKIRQGNEVGVIGGGASAISE